MCIRKQITGLLCAVLMLSIFRPYPTDVQAAQFTRQVEDLNRGIIAVSTNNGVFVSWRYLGTDSPDIGFNIYNGGKKLNEELLKDSTNFLDASGNEESSYYVEAIVNGKVADVSDVVSPYADNYFDIPLSVPQDGITPTGESYTYNAGDASCADLDGDGEYEIILKWSPSNEKDTSHDGYTGNVLLDAYKLDGTQLWRIDLGVNIRAGAHYTQFMVYDLDGDGYAEMVCKTADGTKDGVGTVIGDADADHRNAKGRILTGPEYLTLFDGQTGKALDTIDYEPARGNVLAWGDDYGNRVDRFLGAVAYLDGQKPSVIMCRGYYTRTVLTAYDVIDKKLVKRWIFDSDNAGNSDYAGQGNHNLAVADADGDGYDEVIYGSCTIDHDGTGLYSSKLGHGDAIHVGDFVPDSPGPEIWSVLESAPYGAALRKASNGEIIFRWTAGSDTGRGIAGNFIDGNGSAEFSASCTGNLADAAGETVGAWSEITKWSQNFALYWDGDLVQEVLDRTMIDGYKKGRVFTAPGVAYINGTKANCSLCADMFGDWREEVIWPLHDNSALRIFTTTHMTNYRIHTLMHDTQYRCQVASQNIGYNQCAHTSFFLESGYELPKQPNVKAVKAGQTEDKIPYVDVAETDWFYESVYYNYFAKTMTGMDDTHFGPYGQLSRAQFALILYRINGETEVTTASGFADIQGGEWYGPAVLWAAEHGIVTGYQNGCFGPADMITREQMALMMYRYANYLGKDTGTKADISVFDDAESVSGYALDALKWANGMGIITGKENGTKLDPQGNTARCEAAAIIERFMRAYMQ